mmetsp:Transcript_119837/g.284739  ORF Transcript_119837/g.284739 Transcript_119837/m.284739 type:complete len:229 (+) Transcript_119837:345-1031(+)
MAGTGPTSSDLDFPAPHCGVPNFGNVHSGRASVLRPGHSSGAGKRLFRAHGVGPLCCLPGRCTPCQMGDDVMEPGKSLYLHRCSLRGLCAFHRALCRCCPPAWLSIPIRQCNSSRQPATLPAHELRPRRQRRRCHANDGGEGEPAGRASRTDGQHVCLQCSGFWPRPSAERRDWRRGAGVRCGTPRLHSADCIGTSLDGTSACHSQRPSSGALRGGDWPRQTGCRRCG